MTYERDVRHGETYISPQQRIEGLLRRAPSGPDFAQSTITYTDECIDAATAKFGEVLVRKFPDLRPVITDKLQGMARIHHRNVPKSSFITEGDLKLLEYPNGVRWPLNRLGEAIFHANPELGVFQYAVALFPPRNPRDAHQRFPWFNNRMVKIVDVGELSLDDPRVKYIGVGYVTQVGKAFATNRSQELLRKAQPFAGVDAAERVTGYLDGIGTMVSHIRADQYFIAKGLTTMNTIAEEGGLDEQEKKLLLDLAFIKNKAFDQPEEFKQALEPLIRLVAAGNWEEAFTHRDFLLHYFSTSFPAWRRREYEASGTTTFTSFKDLARAVVQHRLVIHNEDVPGEYKKSFGDILPKKVERAQKERDKQIVRTSVGLSNTIVKELANQTNAKLATNYMVNIFGDQAEEVKRIITDPSKSKDDRHDDFLGLMDPEINANRIEDLYKALMSKLNPKYPPYPLPDGMPVLAVELMDDKQACWYQTEHSAEVRLKGGTVVMMKNWINFGRELHNIILLAHQQPLEESVLDSNEVKMALQRAYQHEKEHDPVIAQFTLSDYVMALLNSVNFTPKLTDVDPVIRFVKELKN